MTTDYAYLIAHSLLFARLAMDRRGSQGWTRVLLKGQMRYIDDMDAIIFLCSPL